MKRRYFKEITTLAFAAVLFFSSCLKDASRTFSPGTGATSNIALLYNSGLANFSADAVTASGLDTIVFAVGVTAPTPPTTASTITLAVDNTIITTYNAANTTITYLPIPAAAYKLVTSVTIPAGQNSVKTTVIIDRTQLDPTLSYMLPVKIASTSGGIPISSNYYVHYFHIIGNDFAGAYTHNFTRIPAANFTGHTDTFFPDSPTQFEVAGGYYNALLRYVVTFTKTGTGASAMYSNFAISMNSDDVATLTAAGVAITTAPSIVGYNSSSSYTYAQALALFANGFTYQVLGGSGARTNLDQYVHQ